jgi:alanine dehydrogenase
MTLIIPDELVKEVLDMGACIDALRAAFLELGAGQAVNRPRSHSFTKLDGDQYYTFKSMDGSLPSRGVHAIRMSSDLMEDQVRFGRRRRDKLPAAPGGRYVGLVMLFDMRQLYPLAIIQEGFLQRMRVGATSAIAAEALSRPDARTAAVIGSGWQAGAQILGLQEVLPIQEYRVYSPNRENLEAFCESQRGVIRADVRPMDSAREAVAGADVVALSTNSMVPVVEGQWLEAGQHVGSLQGYEIDQETLERSSVIVARDREPSTYHAPRDWQPAEATERKELSEELLERVVTLGEVLAGISPGRTRDEDITLFTGGGTGVSAGLGIQFTAVGHAVYESAREHGGAHEVPIEWFTQTTRP